MQLEKPRRALDAQHILCLMMEQAHIGESHGNAVLVASCNHRVVLEGRKNAGKKKKENSERIIHKAIATANVFPKAKD